jgi:hypothetical protein
MFLVIYHAEGCPWAIVPQVHVRRGGWLIRLTDESITTSYDDLVAEGGRRLARLLLCKTLAQAKRNVEKLERALARAEAERQAALRRLEEMK